MGLVLRIDITGRALARCLRIYKETTALRKQRTVCGHRIIDVLPVTVV